MLEFYLVYVIYEDLIELIEELFNGLGEEIHGVNEVMYGEHILLFKCFFVCYIV